MAGEKILDDSSSRRALIDLFDEKNATKWENANFKKEKVARSWPGRGQAHGKEFADEGLGAEIKHFYGIRAMWRSRTMTGDYTRECCQTYVACKVEGNEEREQILLRYVPPEVDKKYRESTLEFFKNGEEHGGSLPRRTVARSFESILMTREKTNTGPAFKCELNQWKKSSKKSPTFRSSPRRRSRRRRRAKRKRTRRGGKGGSQASEAGDGREARRGTTPARSGAAAQWCGVHSRGVHRPAPDGLVDADARPHGVTVDQLRQMKSC